MILQVFMNLGLDLNEFRILFPDLIKSIEENRE